MTLRQENIVPRGVVQLTNGEAAQAGEAASATNVRECEQALQVVGTPTAIGAVSSGHRLLLVFNDKLLTASGLEIFIDGEAVTTASSDIVGAVAIGSLVVVACSAGFIYLAERDGAWVTLDIADAMPQLTITTDTATSSANIAAHIFAEPYTQWAAPLADDDTAALAKALRTAWRQLTADIAAEGRHSAPMLVRWAVRLHDDTYLWISEPVRVGNETLTNADRISAQVRVDSDAGFTGTEATTLTLTHYALTFDVQNNVAADWLPLVKSIDVYATAEANLLNNSSALDYRCVTSATGTRSYALEMGLSRRGSDAIDRQLATSSWTLVATATVNDDDTGFDEFVHYTQAQTLTNEQCDHIGASMDVGSGVACATTAGGRLYYCTTNGDVVVSEAGNALVEAHRRTLFGMSPIAMAVVTHPLWSGGFGRYPVYVFTDDGIYAIPQSATLGTLGEARLVDRTVIEAGITPVEGGGDVWFASRHHQVCRLHGAQLTVMLRDTLPTALAWCNTYRELWITTADNYPLVVLPSGRTVTRTVDATQLYSDPRHALAVTDAGVVLNLEQETEGTMPVVWQSHPVPLHPLLGSVVQRVAWHLTSSDAQLTLILTGCRGIMSQELELARVEVSGAVSQPLAMMPMSQRARTATLRVAGAAASGTLLLPTLLWLAPARRKLR